MMNEDGDLTIDNFKSKYPDETALIEALSACAATSKKADSCETAKAMYDCYRSKTTGGS